MKTASEIHSNAVFLWSSVLFDAVLGLSAVFAVLASPPRLPEGSLWVLGALSCALALIVPAWSFSRAEKGRLERSIESNRLIANAGTAISIIFLVLLSGLVSGAAVASGALKIDGAIVFSAPITCSIGGIILLLLRHFGKEGRLGRAITYGATFSAVLFEGVVLSMARITGAGAAVVFVAAGMLVASTVAAISFVGIYSFIHETSKKMKLHGTANSSLALLIPPVLAAASFEWAVLMKRTGVFAGVSGFVLTVALFLGSGLLLTRAGLWLSRPSRTWDAAAGILVQILAFLAIWTVR